jgi:hypothetical protein
VVTENGIGAHQGKAAEAESEKNEVEHSTPPLACDGDEMPLLA